MVSIFMFIEEWLAPNQKFRLLRNPRPQKFESFAFLFSLKTWHDTNLIFDNIKFYLEN